MADPAFNWLYLDLNSYFASVEQQESPALRGRPVAVAPVMSDSSCAIAASYQAKKFGIRTGTRIYEAKRLCPNLVVVPARHDIYVKYHRRILEAVDRHIPVEKVCSIDEVACRLIGPERERSRAIGLAQALKQELHDSLGECITASIGLAPNRFLAKVATDIEKPNGLVTIEPHELPDKLLGLSLRDLSGIGESMEQRLNAAGITDILGLWNIAPKHARRIWGSVAGENFWYGLHGLDAPSAPESGRKGISHSHVLGPKLRQPDNARLVARQLAVKAASRLRRYGMLTGAVSLFVRSENGASWGEDFRLTRTRDNFVILDGLEQLWARMIRVTGKGLVKQVGIALHDLSEAALTSPDLFARAVEADPRGRTARRTALSAVMDEINRGFGRNRIMLGEFPKQIPDYTGSKVAFTRIPEMEEFVE